jgi:hypothetical protein
LPEHWLCLLRNIHSDEEFEQIVTCFKPRLIRKAQFLLQEDDLCKHDYFVVKGALRQYHVHHTKEWVNQFAFEGWWISDWYSMLHNAPSCFYRISFQRAFSAQQKRIAFMQKSAEDRYKEFTAMYGRFEQSVSQAQIASYLGITRESLSRIKKPKLKK